MEENLKPYKDMYFAAALISYGVPFEGVDRTNKDKQKFIFINVRVEKVYTFEQGSMLLRQNQTLDDLESCFIANTLVFLPSYPDSLRRVKSAIHSGS